MSVNGILPVACRITTPGGWLDLMAGPYRLSADAFVEQQVTWRRSDVTNPFVDGAWTVMALQENVVEQLDVWIRGETTAQTNAAKDALLAALSQLHFGLEVTFDKSIAYYQCSVADVVVKSPRELRFARMLQVSASVPRQPRARIGEVA